MIMRVVKVGKGRHRTDQAITTTYSTEDGQVREHVTMETPPEITETQRLRLMSVYEEKKSWQDQ